MSHESRGNSLEAIRDRLGKVKGRDYWRRLEDESSSPAVLEFLKREFPSQATRFFDEVPRRDFLRMMGASLALGGLGACTRQPDEVIVPFSRNPEWTLPGGRPQLFATSMPQSGGALGLLVESHMGRPTKVEGNPEHPASLGATDTTAQAATLSLYDPDRSHSVLKAGQIQTWEDFQEALGSELDGIETVQGEGLAVLVGEVLSPTTQRMLRRLAEKMPRAKVHSWYPIHRDNARAGAELALGRDVSQSHRLEKARVVLSLDADFLGCGADSVRNARGFAQARRVRGTTEEINRLYAVESSVTITGAAADERLALRPSQVEGFARALARTLGIEVEAPDLDPEMRPFLEAVAADLRTHTHSSLVMAGAWQSPVVHALTHAINFALGNVGDTVEYRAPIAYGNRAVTESLAELTADIRAEKVRVLAILGGNPVYDAPVDLEFREALLEVPFRFHLALHEDETSQLCHWHLPQAHFLESWGDVSAHDGTASFIQPLIAPLYGGRSEIEILSALLGEPGKKGYDLVRETWQARFEGEDFEAFWANALHEGVVADSRRPPLELTPRTAIAYGEPPKPSIGIELSLRPDANVFDGRFANNGWLQETPRPLTRLVWDNAALISPSTAKALDVESGDVVELALGSHRLEAPVWVTPNHPNETVSLHLGYGRTKGGNLGEGVGVNAYTLRTTYGCWSGNNLTVTSTGRSYELATVQKHPDMEGRDIVRVQTFDRFKHPHDAGDHGHHDVSELSMYPGHENEGYAWGMIIDLNACIGCNSCMVACQSENNVPIVGKQEVAIGREMHWLRIDRYYEGEGEAQKTLHQPVPCMHCEEAPCEVVCPVGATVHSDEGLNEMVYNRCVGTRYCSNNCPYKVRRFNFYHYADYETESLKLGNNPDVTIRSRGVMEKCTYCVQRINHGRIEAKKEDRTLTDGEVQTACQSSCPTQAISFGNLNDPESQVTALRKEPHHYALLEELGTKPRTTYLGKVTNPNPDLEPS